VIKIKVSLIQATPNPIKQIADIASICYGKKQCENPNKLVKFLYENGHHSVFEHIYFTFKIEGVSRACSHQLVRHRMCSFTQKSQRYCDESEYEGVMPESMKSNENNLAFMYGVGDYYKTLLATGIPKEDARYILPNACQTDLYLSCNLRELIHVANERLCKKAQWEIRELVQNMVELIDPQLKYMLVPRCQSGLIICHGCE